MRAETSSIVIVIDSRSTPQEAITAATETAHAPTSPAPPTAEIRAWARAAGLTVPDRGQLRPEIRTAWHEAHQP